MTAPARREALRRAGRVTVAACAGFYLGRYVLDDTTTATYALFTAISLGVLSEVRGTPDQRTRVLLAAVACGLGLVTVGTLAAVSTWTAVAGMLVVGFAVAYAGVGGPRVAGVANGLQLFYVLPCFPPFAPDTLGERLTGLAAGGFLLVVADRWLWPAASPPPAGTRIAGAARSLAEHAAALAALLRAPTDATRAAERTARAAVADATAGLRMSDVPVAERPLGPGVGDRALLVAASAVRTAAGRTALLGDLPDAAGLQPRPAMADLVAATGGAFGELAAALTAAARTDPGRTAATGAPAPDPGPVDAALAAYLADRERRIASIGSTVQMRSGLAAVDAAEEARIAVLAVRGVLGAPPPAPDATPPALWFLHAGRAELWRRRLRAHLTPRSVYLQNAVRLALGLAAARVVADLLVLSHGFWVLLATLSLMRTSAVAGRAVLVPAFVGTVVGAFVGGGVLALVGTHTGVYAATLPVIMLVAFTAGPLLGVAVAQGAFTVVVSLVFAQLAPATWQLAEVRLVDVVVGGLTGALIGAAVWPRGGGGEVRKVAAVGLRDGAAEVTATVGHLVGDREGPGSGLSRICALYEHTYAQFRTEPGVPGRGPDWLVVLGVLHRLQHYSAALRDRYPRTAPPPWPDRAAHLRDAADAVAQAYRAVADAVGSSAPPPAAAGAQCRARFRTSDRSAELARDPDAALRVLDTWGWLYVLVDDVDLLERAFGDGGPPGPVPHATGTGGTASRGR